MDVVLGLNPTDSVLFLGNNDQSTDLAVSRLALSNNTHNHGLIADAEYVPEKPGFWHTSVADVNWGGLINLASRFDSIVMLDQPQNEWSHWKCLLSTCKIMLQLEKLSKRTVFRDNANASRILYWIDLLYQKNSSFCIYPWINLHNDGSYTKLCSRDPGTVALIDELCDWKNDSDYNRIREAMLRGDKLPEHCGVCYQYEEQGIESYRQFETLDWVTQLDLKNTDDLSEITHPRFYEVHTSNHCNIKCRGCSPSQSRPIEIEYRKFKITAPTPIDPRPGKIDHNAPDNYDLALIDIDKLDGQSSVYFQGGEPTIMPEVREFMRRCISRDRTDFFLTMCTNGVKFSRDFLHLVSHFPNTNFSFSIDGFDLVNDYWRWGSRWQQVIDNAHLMQSLGHSVSINTVPGIYNVTNLHLLFEFLDREFPMTTVYMQVNYLPWQSAFNHPDSALVVESMQRCQQTSMYHSNGKSCKTCVDSIHDYYANDPVCDLQHLRNFFDFNDRLDSIRGSKLADYIPELEAARRFLS